ncbi:hypothetical protein KIPB_014794, partial [Kipferlia bialata]
AKLVIKDAHVGGVSAAVPLLGSETLLVTGGADKQVKVWDTSLLLGPAASEGDEAMAEERPLTPVHTFQMGHAVDVVAASSGLVFVGADREITTFDVASGEALASAAVVKGTGALHWSPSSGVLIAGGLDGTLRLYKPTLDIICNVTRYPSAVMSVTQSKSGSILSGLAQGGVAVRYTDKVRIHTHTPTPIFCYYKCLC